MPVSSAAWPNCKRRTRSRSRIWSKRLGLARNRPNGARCPGRLSPMPGDRFYVPRSGSTRIRLPLLQRHQFCVRLSRNRESVPALEVSPPGRTGTARCLHDLPRRRSRNGFNNQRVSMEPRSVKAPRGRSWVVPGPTGKPHDTAPASRATVRLTSRGCRQ